MRRPPSSKIMEGKRHEMLKSRLQSRLWSCRFFTVAGVTSLRCDLAMGFARPLDVTEQLGDRLIRFAGGQSGVWRVLVVRSVRGEVLPQVERVAVYRGSEPSPLESRWTLSGVISNTRYVERPEQQELTLKQAPLSRSEATRAALIPIRKTAAWWNLTQEERRNVFENKSHHIAEGIRYLPSVARQLYHSRDIGEPFDFLTWFEYAPQHSEAFEELVRTLRNTEEWRYVDREIDIRLTRD